MPDPSASIIGQQIAEAIALGWTQKKVENYIDALEPGRDNIPTVNVPWLLHRYVMHRVGHGAFTGGVSRDACNELYEALPPGIDENLTWPTIPPDQRNATR